MANYVGFDCLVFPGDDQMAWLKQNTNLRWCGYYLAPTPSHSNQSWMGSRTDLIAAGWGLLAIYVGQQTVGPGSHNVSAAQGLVDGAQAAALAASEGFPGGAFVYLDIEDGSPLAEDARAYVVAWASKLIEGNYAPGFYCSHLIATDLAAILDEMNPTPVARVWPFKLRVSNQPHAFVGDIANLPAPNPATSGFAGATALQYEQNAILALPGAPTASLMVDLSSANVTDPSGTAPQFVALHKTVRRMLLAKRRKAESLARGKPKKAKAQKSHGKSKKAPLPGRKPKGSVSSTSAASRKQRR